MSSSINRIYVSTSSFYKYKLHKIVKILSSKKIYNLELSASLYNKNQLKELLKFKNKNVNFIFHNYFLPPKKEFIINLSSNDKFIIQRSINHIKKLIKLANIFNIKFVSFHAGFRFDPNHKSIGKIFKKQNLHSEKKALEIFFKSVKALSKYAKKFNINLLIENNVITKKNFEIFKENPLLFCCPEKIKKILEKMPNNVGLLLDVGHFKISSKTLNFNLLKGYRKIRKYIKGYHLNDNDGISDKNFPFTKKSWFVGILKKNLNYYSIEVNKKFKNYYPNLINITKKNI